MAGKKTEGKKQLVAKALVAKASKKQLSKRASEVEANLGRTQKLRDFLREAGWD